MTIDCGYVIIIKRTLYLSKATVLLMINGDSRRRRRRNPLLGYLTVDEAAEIARLSPGAIRWNISKGFLPAEFDGYRYHIRPQDLQRFLELYYD